MSSTPKDRVSKPDRVIVVTGATGDAGRAVAEALEATGALVVAVGTNSERLASVIAHSRYVCDLSDAAATSDLAARIHAEVGPVDGLIHLVGGWRAGRSDDDWAWLEPRLLGSLRNTTLAFHEDLSASPAGRMVFVGSASADAPTWSNANYATLKAAGAAWVASLASGWRKAGSAAAVTLVVTSLGPDGTGVRALADTVTSLWDRPAAELNGISIPLPAGE